MSFAGKPGEPAARDAVRRAFGALLMLLGAMMAALCGLCSALVVYIGLSYRSDALTSLDGFASTVGVAALFGGPPILVGLGLFFWGRRLRRGKGTP